MLSVCVCLLSVCLVCVLSVLSVCVSLPRPPDPHCHRLCARWDPDNSVLAVPYLVADIAPFLHDRPGRLEALPRRLLCWRGGSALLWLLLLWLLPLLLRLRLRLRLRLLTLVVVHSLLDSLLAIPSLVSGMTRGCEGPQRLLASTATQ